MKGAWARGRGGEGGGLSWGYGADSGEAVGVGVWEVNPPARCCVATEQRVVTPLSRLLESGIAPLLCGWRSTRILQASPVSVLIPLSAWSGTSAVPRIMCRAAPRLPPWAIADWRICMCCTCRPTDWRGEKASRGIPEPP